MFGPQLGSFPRRVPHGLAVADAERESCGACDHDLSGPVAIDVCDVDVFGREPLPASRHVPPERLASRVEGRGEELLRVERYRDLILAVAGEVGHSHRSEPRAAEAPLPEDSALGRERDELVIVRREDLGLTVAVHVADGDVAKDGARRSVGPQRLAAGAQHLERSLAVRGAGRDFLRAVAVEVPAVQREHEPSHVALPSDLAGFVLTPQHSVDVRQHKVKRAVAIEVVYVHGVQGPLSGVSLHR